VPILQEKGANIRIYDPEGRHQGEVLLPEARWCESALEAAEGADITVVLTEWNEFRVINLDYLRKIMRGDVLVDLRNVYEPKLAQRSGFRFWSLGRTSYPNASATAEGNILAEDEGCVQNDMDKPVFA